MLALPPPPPPSPPETRFKLNHKCLPWNNEILSTPTMDDETVMEEDDEEEWLPHPHQVETKCQSICSSI